MALVEAVRTVTGLATTTEGIPVHGMLDPDILTLMMRAGGFDDAAIARALPAVIETAQDVYQPGVPDLRDKRCLVMALVTGNLTRIGWRKLERAGLHHYFRFGAFAEMAATRGGLARLAIERARREGLIGDGESISLVGDAPQDVMAARENGIRSIAVRTGISSAEELERLAPDVLIDDLNGLDLGIF